uniref:Doublecortin domain-containing protein n=1 Tax=Leptobrachium leishanense TaxID=445787 RepID=A0A8C5M4P8_9ANUR
MEGEERTSRYVTILQAHVRGFLIRRKMQHVQEEYMAMAKEIEGENISLLWNRGPVFMPQIITEGNARNHSSKGILHYTSIGSTVMDSSEDSQKVQPGCEPFTTANRGERDNWHLNDSDSQRTRPERDLSTNGPESYLANNGSLLSQDIGYLFGTDQENGRKLTDDVEWHKYQETNPRGSGCITGMESFKSENVHTERYLVHSNTDKLRQLETNTPEQTNNCIQEAKADNFIDPSQENSTWSMNCVQSLSLLASGIPLKNLHELRQHRSHLAMEMLWVQQAILSRKNAPAAVRNIYTPRNGHRVNNISDLINKGQYVAAGTEKFRKLDYLHTEVKPPAVLKRRDTQQVPRKVEIQARWRDDNHSPCIIHVFRNGDLRTPPFRVLLAPGILREWELVLTLLTEKANLYNGAVRRLCTLDGVSLSSGSELVSGEYYVAVGSEKYKCLPYEELLTLHRNKSRNNIRRRIPKAVGVKVYSVSQDGTSDAALIDPSTQGGSRRVQSTGVTENSSYKNPNREEESVFYAKPVRVRPTQKKGVDQEKNESIFKVQKTRHELEGAQEVKEDTHTHVEVPVDQRLAEVVQEEDFPKDRKAEHTVEFK